MSKTSRQLWAAGQADQLVIADQPTAFELKVRRLGLENSPESWADSNALRTWVKAHKNSRYIPESLIQELGLQGFYEGD
jgi:hypothetical protein